MVKFFRRDSPTQPGGELKSSGELVAKVIHATDKQIEWRVYYGDGTTADNISHCLPELPAWDCQMIVQRDEKHNRNVASGRDYFVYHLRDCRWYPVDFTGLLDYLANEFENIGKVLIGRYIPNAEFDAIEKRATVDPDFPLPGAGRGRFD